MASKKSCDGSGEPSGNAGVACLRQPGTTVERESTLSQGTAPSKQPVRSEKPDQQEKPLQTEKLPQPKPVVIPPPSQQVIVSSGKGAIPKDPKAKPSGANNKIKKSVPPNTAGNVKLVAVRRNPTRRGRDNRVSHCGLCDERDDCKMVQCDACKAWYHYSCVEVMEKIAEVSWMCPDCAIVTTYKTPSAISTTNVPHKPQLPTSQQQTQNSFPNDVVSVKSSGKASSKRSEARRRIELELEKLEEQTKLQQQYLDRKYSLLQELGSETSSVISNIDSVCENMQKVTDWIESTDRCGDDSGLAGEEMEDEPDPSDCGRVPEHQAVFRRPPEGYPDDEAESIYSRAVLDHLASHSRTAGVSLDNAPVRTNPMSNVGAHSILRRPTQEFPSNLRQSRNQRSVILPPARRIETGISGETFAFIPGQGSTPVRQAHLRSTVPTSSNVEETVCVLNRSQLAARQAVPKDLPDFSGNPEDWPLFYSLFYSSTQMCGFSNEENMLRLRKCLKGKALEAVRCRLLHPSNISGVMSTLKMLYGRPEAIVQAIIKKIRSLPPPNIEKLDTVVNFALNVENLVATIEACEVDDFMYNASLKYELIERLPSTLKLDWAKSSRDNPAPNLLDFSQWLYRMAEDASAVAVPVSSEYRPRGGKKDGFLNLHSEAEYQLSTKSKEGHSASKLNAAKEFSKECVVCKGSCSSLTKCKRFTDLNYDSKWAVVRQFKLCRKCLRKHNGSCNRKTECGLNGCSYLHHPLLHGASSERQQAGKSPTQEASSPAPNPETSCNIHQGQSSVLFRIVPVILHGPSKAIQTYAFVDDGSELTLMEQSLADELEVKGPGESLCLRWTGGACRTENGSQKVNLQISCSNNPSKKYNLSNVHTVGGLQLRSQTLLVPEMQKKYQHLAGLPLESYLDVSPRILIGLDHASLGYAMKSREGKPHEPIAIKTRLGWMMYGSCSSGINATHFVNYHSLRACPCNAECNEDLHDAVKHYFCLDSLGIVKPSKILLSNEDQRAQTLLETLTRPVDGHYESGLLWRYDNVRLPESKAMALRRWECLERRLSKDPVLAGALRSKMSEYVTKGYIRKLSTDELKASLSRVWYLPMFPVVNPNKPGKTRLVWDAAATSHGISLNSMLLKGPDQLTSLLSVLIKFRESRVAVCGDIREMYHQVRLREDDQHCHRFFWKDSEADEKPSVYIMQVMSFGACCSPSTAQYTKNINAERFEQEHPKAVFAIIHQHYVDDMLVSAETDEAAIELVRDVKTIHEAGGFEMRNWVSNSTAVLEALHGERTKEKSLSVGEESSIEKILGMWWDTTTDCFTYKLSARHDAELLSGRRRPTKREVLRTLMMVFDPLGLISHFLMFLKMLLQEIWRTSVGWDDQIEDAQHEKWLLWLRVLPEFATVSIPRCYRTSTTIEADNEVQMHTFVDASEAGFAAVVYLRFLQGSTIECALAGAKTRVAPLKFLSIPRSELQSAVIGVRLADTIMNSLTFKVHKRFFWTDSRDVMCWLNSDHRRYSQFVAVRISEVLETTNLREWNWVSTKLNVADEGTKWKRAPDLKNSSRWFRGPEFLWKPEMEWPTPPGGFETTDIELRPHLLLHSVAVSVINPEDFEGWFPLLRSIAYMYRGIENLRRNANRTPLIDGPLSQGELVKAECFLYRLAQRSAFPDEVSILSQSPTEGSKTQVPKNSPIFRLCPYLDEKGILRVRGRTAACKFIDYDATYPIILPRDHFVTKLLVKNVHQKLLHQNHDTALNELRQRFCIPRLKAVYRAVRNECQRCKNDQAHPQPPLMSDLPDARLAAYCRPFTHMGVDYFGPMMVLVGRRSEKRWGVLVTCLTTRGIHLEVAHSLTTDSCILALRNVMARRGVPAVIYSDRGTNFQGASKELLAVVESLDHEQIMAEFTSPHTSWSFIPPASPHMGGAWERLIRTVKQNLSKLQPIRIPTDEVLRNMLIEVENIVNSRPLTSIPLDDDQSPVLTPNHFLIGSSNGLKPWAPFDDSATALKQNWRLSQCMANLFWKLWLQDYLPTLTRRTKWFTEVKPIQVNDIVVIADPKLPRNYWPKGRVIATTSSKDGQVRSATVQTATGIYERPAVKIAVLDVGVGGNTPSDDPRPITGGSVSCATSTSDPNTPRRQTTLRSTATPVDRTEDRVKIKGHQDRK